MPGFGEWGRHPTARHLEGVGGLPHRIGVVQAVGDRIGGLGDLVQIGAVTVLAVSIDSHLDDTASTRRNDIDAVQLQPQLIENRGHHGPHPVTAHSLKPVLLSS